MQELRPLAPDDNKYSRGVVAVHAGSRAFPGAAVLAVGGARRGGAGYVRYLERDERATSLVLTAFPDVVPGDIEGRADAWVIGPGFEAVTPDVTTILSMDVAVVLDGGALAAARARSGITVLTPHEGEAQRMGFDTSNRERCAREMARAFDSIVVLKGMHTIICSAGGRMTRDDIGGPELSTAGTGDILAGLIGSMLASWRPNHSDAHNVVAAAVRRHSLAGQVAAGRHSVVTATDVLDSLNHLK